MKLKPRNLFMKWLTWDRVVPIISASISWLIFATIGSGFPSFPKLANSRAAGQVALLDHGEAVSRSRHADYDLNQM
jgi:hypothetical protein